jgi:rhodanese-related sulfurtransferase
MPTQIVREDVAKLMQAGAVVIEVLSEQEYREEHIAGAINIPLAKLNRRNLSQLDRHLPVVVYCYDYQ